MDVRHGIEYTRGARMLDVLALGRDDHALCRLELACGFLAITSRQRLHTYPCASRPVWPC